MVGPADFGEIDGFRHAVVVLFRQFDYTLNALDECFGIAVFASRAVVVTVERESVAILENAVFEGFFQKPFTGANRVGDDHTIRIGLFHARIGGGEEFRIAFGIALPFKLGSHSATAVPFVPNLVEAGASLVGGGHPLGESREFFDRLGGFRITRRHFTVMIRENMQRRKPCFDRFLKEVGINRREYATPLFRFPESPGGIVARGRHPTFLEYAEVRVHNALAVSEVGC
ncbi:hypothetical protein SDC9_102682 [bioreactor metagenome]|uniref:Uncharacterized protein n=1 Tax=bioreactor metagenome TaxID=1076179 RepID=A0A645B2F1_9ZZZZ